MSESMGNALELRWMRFRPMLVMLGDNLLMDTQHGGLCGESRSKRLVEAFAVRARRPWA